jgi:hypothetical protein
MEKTWTPIPLYTTIVEILTKKGSLKESELLKEIGSKYKNISIRELNNALMKLEIRGAIRVTRLLKNKRMIELAPNV